jgi:hypothetical protein
MQWLGVRRAERLLSSKKIDWLAFIIDEQVTLNVKKCTDRKDKFFLSKIKVMPPVKIVIYPAFQNELKLQIFKTSDRM